MEKIYQYLLNLNPDLLMVLILTLLFSSEQLFTNVTTVLKRSTHLLNNIFLQLGYVALNYGLATLVVAFSDWLVREKIGLFSIITIPNYLKVPLGVFAIDLVNYWAHRLNHTWQLFWRLHRVHHSDTTMDSSTTYRFHPLDALLDNFAGIAAMGVFGLDASVLLLWLILYIPLLVLHHSNFIMPTWFDKTIGKIIVSPNFHKVHHHQDQKYTDSNYGLLFVLWDKLFRTFKKLPINEIKYGLREFDQPNRQKFWFLLISPFINVKK